MIPTECSNPYCNEGRVTGQYAEGPNAIATGRCQVDDCPFRAPAPTTQEGDVERVRRLVATYRGHTSPSVGHPAIVNGRDADALDHLLSERDSLLAVVEAARDHLREESPPGYDARALIESREALTRALDALSQSTPEREADNG